MDSMLNFCYIAIDENYIVDINDIVLLPGPILPPHL